jgi:hypothetical protein
MVPDRWSQAVGQGNAVLRHRDVHAADVVGADLVAQASRSGVDQDGDLPGAQSEGGRRRLVEDPVHDLHFDEVVARADRAELVAAPVLRLVGDLVGVGAAQAAVRLGDGDVRCGGHPAFGEVADAPAQHLVHLRLVENDVPAVPHARGE